MDSKQREEEVREEERDDLGFPGGSPGSTGA